MGNEAFAVPKDKQQVTVHLLSGQRVDGLIFLEYSAEEQSIYRKISFFLEDGNDFFPLRVGEAGATEFINKKNVRMLEVAYSGKDPETDADFNLMQAVKIMGIFANQTTVHGALLAEVPEEKARLSDCLNMTVRFLTVKADGKICYVNKDFLQKVVYGEKS